ncbi:MAG: hypothetical protein ABW224_13135 [Kibdelosporangium sp.]
MADNEQPNHPVPYDPDQQRQFEQFQQYQQFLKFQEMQGQLPPGTTSPTPQAPKGKPWWRKILGSKLFYRLLGLVVVIAAVAWGCTFVRETLNPATKDDGLGVAGGSGPGGEEQRLNSENPNAAIAAVYNYVSAGDKNACRLFEPIAAKKFADDFGASDCEAAVRRLAGTVDRAPEVKPLTWSGVQTLTVSSCAKLKPKPGARLLGEFTFTKHSNGWLVSGHESEPDPCPAPTTTTVPTTIPTTTTSR